MGNSLWFCTAAMFCGTRSAPRPLLRRQLIPVLSVPEAVTAPGATELVTMLLLWKDLQKWVLTHLFFREQQRLVSQQYLLHFTYVSLAPFEEEKAWIKPLFQPAAYKAQPAPHHGPVSIALLTQHHSGTGMTCHPHIRSQRCISSVGQHMPVLFSSLKTIL